MDGPIKRMLCRLLIITAAVLTVWVGGVAAVVEYLNARAGFYLPRHDLYDGKWRRSFHNTPRDLLCDLVHGAEGLLQLPLSVVLGLGALIALPFCRSPSDKWILRTALAVAAVALASFLYRGYFTS